jgi:hypothetical protein
MTAQINQRPTAIRRVLPFVFRHWLHQPVGASIVAGGLLGAEASGEQRGEGSLGRNGGAKAYDEGGLAIVGVKVRRFR